MQGKENAMIELTEDQARAVGAMAEKPPTMVDPRTNLLYVLIRKDLYDRLTGLLYDTSESSDEELRLLLARSATANGWEEPGMEGYDHYDEERRKQCR